MYYAGVTGNIKDRWIPSAYGDDTSLYPYINKYGWENIEHAVVVDGLDYNDALKIEDVLICFYRSISRSINKMRSGLITYDDEYYKTIRKEYWSVYNKLPHVKERMRVYEKHYKHEYNKQPQEIIYRRVYDYNRTHTPIETPLEAKRKYLDSGGTVIPQYIKHDDI